MALCSNPYITPSQIPANCGKCRGCLTNRKQLWTHRIILESMAHDKNCFVTLTYDDDHFPKDSSLDPDTLQRFIKRLRRRSKDTFRFYAVGEYGTSTGRGPLGVNPHYHLCLFGLGENSAEDIGKSWTEEGEPIGYVYTGSLTPQSAAYVAGYVQKKDQYNKDMYDEMGLYHEFARMSNRPGIGYSIVPELARQLEKYPEAMLPSGDVPISLKHGKRMLPLGQYLREKLREEMGLDHTVETHYNEYTGEVKYEKKTWHAKELQKAAYRQELSDMQKNSEDPKITKDAQASLKHCIEYHNKQAILNFEARQRFNVKEKTL